MENKQIKPKEKKEKKYSDNFDLNSIKDYDHPDRKYNSVMDEYRRYFGVQKKCKVNNLTRDEIWEFFLHFFKETYGSNVKEEDKQDKKYMGKVEGSKHKKITYLHWNVKGYELSIEERGEALLRISMRIHEAMGGKLKVTYKRMVKSPVTLWGMQGEYKKWQMKYWHRRNAKEVFRSLKVLDKYKLDNGNIDGGIEYLKKEADEYRLDKLEKLKEKQAKKDNK